MKRVMSHEAEIVETHEFEPPQLTLIGSVKDIVLGPPGVGWDGPEGMACPTFEFLADEG